MSSEIDVDFLGAYLDDMDVFARGCELVGIMLDDSEIQAAEALQVALRRGVVARGITVEVNPSSNLLIGDLSDLRNHPIFRLSPPEPSDTPSIRIAIGSDDPLTFATNLVHEYSLLREAALAAGYRSDVVEDSADRGYRRDLEVHESELLGLRLCRALRAFRLRGLRGHGASRTSAARFADRSRQVRNCLRDQLQPRLGCDAWHSEESGDATWVDGRAPTRTSPNRSSAKAGHRQMQGRRTSRASLGRQAPSS